VLDINLQLVEEILLTSIVNFLKSYEVQFLCLMVLGSFVVCVSTALIMRLSCASWVHGWWLWGSSCDRRVSAALVERTAGVQYSRYQCVGRIQRHRCITSYVFRCNPQTHLLYCYLKTYIWITVRTILNIASSQTCLNIQWFGTICWKLKTLQSSKFQSTSSYGKYYHFLLPIVICQQSIEL
jgi:hypothetical protein